MLSGNSRTAPKCRSFGVVEQGADLISVGFFLSGTIYYTLCKVFPLDRVDEKDEHDYFGTFGYVPCFIPTSHLSVFPLRR